MTGKPVRLSERADDDALAAAVAYAEAAGQPLADAFAEALEAALSHIALYPASGSTRYAADCDLEALRSWPLRRFPYLVLYVETEERIDIVRILHAHRDIPTTLRDLAE